MQQNFLEPKIRDTLLCGAGKSEEKWKRGGRVGRMEKKRERRNTYLILNS